MRKINLLLDIDGVLSPLGVIDHEDYAIYTNNWTTWRIPYETVRFLHQIKDKINIVNSSAWEADAEGLYRYMLLPIPEMLSYSNAQPNDWLKEKSLKEYILARPHDRTLILDDEFSNSFIEWASKRKEVVLLPVNGLVGIDDPIKDLIKDYITEHRDR